MRELITDRNFQASKILVFVKFILVIALIAFFLPLFVLPFFNHPFGDDYFCGYQLNARGFTGFQTFMYYNWSGRFATTFTWALLEQHNFLYTHYYLFSLALIIFNFISVFFLINVLCRYILKEKFSAFTIALFSFLFFALEVCSVPQMSTFFFWFSSAVNYVLPLILAQTEIALFILLFNSPYKIIRSICALLLPIVIFCTIGFNEVFIIIQFILFGFIFFFKLNKKLSSVFIICVLGRIYRKQRIGNISSW